MELLPGVTNGTDYWGEEVDAPLGAYGNYVGPYWSDGERQTSVRWGEKAPVDEYDNLARMHDAAYANWPDERHRMAADIIFHQEVKKLDKQTGRHMADNPAFAGNAVLYGNYAARRAGHIVTDAGVGTLAAAGAGKKGVQAGATGLMGLAVGEAKYIYDMQKMLDEQAKHGPSHMMREQEDVRDFYKTAPKPTKYSAKASSTAAKPHLDALQESGSVRVPTPAPKGGASTVKVTPLDPTGQPQFVPPPTRVQLGRQLALRQYKKLMKYARLETDAKNKIAVMPRPQAQTQETKTGQKQKKHKFYHAIPAKFRHAQQITPVGAFK